MADDGKRSIPPGSCTLCGHPPHDDDCARSIRTTTGKRETHAPCPCSRYRWAQRESNYTKEHT